MRNLFFLICFFGSLCCMAQKTIIMERESGVFKIPCKVNGAKMKMIFDTGASSVSISSSMAEYLFENDYIKKEDILGTGKSQVADGRVVNNVIINLRDIEIDGIHVKNVQATVSESLTSPLLFGQSAIQKLGKISLNGNKLVLEDVDDNSDNEKLDELKSKAKKYYGEDNFYMAAKTLIEIENKYGLNVDGYDFLCRCYSQLNDNQSLYDTVIRFEENNKNDLDTETAGYIYLGLALSLNLQGNYSESLKWCYKAIGVFRAYPNSKETLSKLYWILGFNPERTNDIFASIESFKKAVKMRCDFLGISDGGVTNDERLGTFYLNLANIMQKYYSNPSYPLAIEYFKKSALCGSEYAQNYLKKYGINY